jgi:hypothetical protein
MGISEAAWESHSGADEMNVAIYAHWADAPLPVVMERFDSAHAELIAALGSLSDADLERPYTDFDRSGDPTRPIVGWIAGNSFGHFDEHLAWLQDLPR